jgi:hypothetical protein
MPGPHRFDPVLLHLVSVARACTGTLNRKEAVLRGRQQSSSVQAAISPDWSSRSVVDQRSCIRMYPRRGSIGRNYTVKFPEFKTPTPQILSKGRDLICQSFELKASARAQCLDASGQLGVRSKARADIVPDEPIVPELIAEP